MVELLDYSLNSLYTISGTFKPGSMNDLMINVPDSVSYTLHLRFSGSGGLSFTNSTLLNVVQQNASIFIQTDKAMYDAGQTVHFRAFAMLPNMTISDKEMNIAIFDPKGNKIKQWLKLKDDSGVVGSSMVMDKHPILGKWKITVKAGNEVQEKYFEVQQYKLPRFEITLDLPDEILLRDSVIHGSIKVLYTFGEPISGTANIEGRLLSSYEKWGYNSVTSVFKHDIAINTNGTATFTIPLASVKQMRNQNDFRKLVVQANVTEDLTNTSMVATKAIAFHTSEDKIVFADSTETTFKPGLYCRAYILVSKKDDVVPAIRNSKVTVTLTANSEDLSSSPPPGQFYYGPRVVSFSLPSLQYTVPQTGELMISFSTPKNATTIYLEVTYGTIKAYHTIAKSHSPSESYLSLVFPEHTLMEGSNANIQVQSTVPVETLVYQIWSRGNLILASTETGRRRYLFNFTLGLTSKMAPSSQIIAYFVQSNGEIVFDSLDFHVHGIFGNKVMINLDKHKALPGEDVTITVSADPKSLVNILAVDQSVLLLKSGNDITEKEVMQKVSKYNHIKDSFDHPTHYSGQDMQTVISNMELAVLTDTTVFHCLYPGYSNCRRPAYIMPYTPYPPTYQQPLLNPGYPGQTAPPYPTRGPVQHVQTPYPLRKNEYSKPVIAIRSRFPETWIWTNQTATDNGTAIFRALLPDTMTSWIINAFAVNKNTGLGISNAPAKVTVFRKFFITLTFPYSVVREEEVIIQVNIFNYLDQDQFVPKGEAKSVYIAIIPQKVGPVPLEIVAQTMFSRDGYDGIRKQMIVEPEGLPVEHNTNIPLTLSTGQNFEENVHFNVPTIMVKDSERVRISVAGDFLGPSINNLNRLLTQPAGCGEQTMINLAPDVFVADYLNKTGQLDQKTRKDVTQYMEEGLQNELRFQRNDGSFSIWGNRDPAGSMWLSAFVAKTFKRAKQYIQVDDEILIKILSWIVDRQNTDGSFPEPFKVHDSSIQGGSGDGLGLSAFVLIALEENKDIAKGPEIQRLKFAALNVRSYIERNVHTVTDAYVLAITSYALYLSESSLADATFTRLNMQAIVQDGKRYWKGNNVGYIDPLDIEMTAYALLSFSHLKSIDRGLEVLKWIISQQNALGGYRSTQDTIVALQAMSEFTSIIRTHHPNMRVTVSTTNFSKDFTITDTNDLVLQSVELQALPQQIHVTASGTGLAVVQISSFYNIKQRSGVTGKRASNNQPFSMTVNLLKETLNLLEIQACTSRHNNDKNGMVVQEIAIPSGFEVDITAIKPVKGLRTVEEKDKNVVFYFDEITTTTVCVQMTATRTGLVAKTKPSIIKVYDYYHPSNMMTSFYTSNVLEHSNVCDICPTCRLCRRFNG